MESKWVLGPVNRLVLAVAFLKFPVTGERRLTSAGIPDKQLFRKDDRSDRLANGDQLCSMTFLYSSLHRSSMMFLARTLHA